MVTHDRRVLNFIKGKGGSTVSLCGLMHNAYLLSIWDQHNSAFEVPLSMLGM